MNSKKYIGMLGLSRRAGKLSMGHDMALKAIKENRAQLVIFSSDISERLIEEFKRAADKSNIKCLKIEETMNDIHFALGYKAGVLTVDDINFSNRITQLINQEGNVYGNKG